MVPGYYESAVQAVHSDSNTCSSSDSQLTAKNNCSTTVQERIAEDLILTDEGGSVSLKTIPSTN